MPETIYNVLLGYNWAEIQICHILLAYTIPHRNGKTFQLGFED